MLMRRPDLSDETFRLLQSLAVVPAPVHDVLLPLLQAVARHRPPSHREALVMTLQSMLVIALGEAANGGKWSFATHDAVEAALFAAFGAIVARVVAKESPRDDAAPLRAAWDAAARSTSIHSRNAAPSGLASSAATATRRGGSPIRSRCARPS